VVTRQRTKAWILRLNLFCHPWSRKENAKEFTDLVARLRHDLAPVGELEELLVEKIAICFCRQKRALYYEDALLDKRFWFVGESYDTSGNTIPVKKINEGFAELCLPEPDEMDHLIWYESSIQRQLAFTLAQLERF